MMKFKIILITVTLVICWACLEKDVEQLTYEQTSGANPVNPSASPEARELLSYLYQISGQKTLSGEHNHIGYITEKDERIHAQYTERVNEIVGRYPVIWGSDFGFSAGGKDPVDNRPTMIEGVKQYHNEGFIITLMWHAVNPVHDEPNEWKKSVWYKMSEEEWTELVTPGTNLHERWLAQIDNIAGYLKELRDANIPVLWRPYHEMNGNWFWWCDKKGENGFKALWRLMFDRYVNYHELNNLLWVWNANAPRGNAGPYADFYPGHEYVDILASDVYRTYEQSHYDDLLALAEGKPIALGEVGTLPTPEILESQPRWGWFMQWSDLLERSNKPEGIKAIYGSPRVLTLDEVELK